jgi:hypothetical protein
VSNEWNVSKVISKRQGVFGNYQLIGLLYGNDRGDRAWHIKQINENPVRDYCVQEGKFFSMQIDVPFSGPIGMRLEKGGLIPDMNEDERRMILDAIATWDSEEALQRDQPNG